jgi:hypothetical protein
MDRPDAATWWRSQLRAALVALLHAEVAERLEAAKVYGRGGHTERAEVTRVEAAVLGEFL